MNHFSGMGDHVSVRTTTDYRTGRDARLRLRDASHSECNAFWTIHVKMESFRASGNLSNVAHGSNYQHHPSSAQPFSGRYHKKLANNRSVIAKVCSRSVHLWLICSECVCRNGWVAAWCWSVQGSPTCVTLPRIIDLWDSGGENKVTEDFPRELSTKNLAIRFEVRMCTRHLLETHMWRWSQ